jgi:hypothetical protein
MKLKGLHFVDVTETQESITDVRGAFKFSGLLIFFSEMEAGRNVKVVGEDMAVL